LSKRWGPPHNESKTVDGIQPWSTVCGEYALSLKKFREEVFSFHERLMEEMTNRIKKLTDDNPIPHIKIDMQSLKTEHEKRKNSLNDAMANTPKVKNWNSVIEAIIQLKGLNKATAADAKSRAAE
jgi:L-rhamnose mutarotase